jgi:hypothetical protein
MVLQKGCLGVLGKSVLLYAACLPPGAWEKHPALTLFLVEAENMLMRYGELSRGTEGLPDPPEELVPLFDILADIPVDHCS